MTPLPEAGLWTMEQKARFLESTLAEVLTVSDPVMPFRAFKDPADCQRWCDVIGRARAILDQARAATKEEMRRVKRQSSAR